MVQGNWERRAELSEARRLEAKQRKQRAGDRKVYKAQAQDLMSFLNRNADKLFRREMGSTIHIWTDSPTKDGSILDDQLWEDEQTKNKRNHKHDADNGKGGRRGRGRSTSFDINDTPKTKNNKKKKFHPRSKDNPNSNNYGGNGQSEAISAPAPKLCRKHFFYGKCCESTQKNRGSQGKKTSTNCRFAHYPKGSLTITDVLLAKRPRDADDDDSALVAKDAISYSESSYPETTLPGEKTPTADAMDMVYYLPFRTNDLFAGLFDDEESSPQVSHAIVDAMTKQSCNIGSIVYFAVGNQLIYDRYRKGIVIEETEITGRNKTSTDKSRSTGRSIQSMPLSASILEHILLFLDDKAVASMSAVSRSWNREIGKQSVNLWRHLLRRRSWPVPSVSQGHNEEGISTLREAFVSHYTAVRDTDGVKKGFQSLLYRKSMNEYDGSVRLFESSKSSSQTANNCMAIKVWDTNSILAAYEHDCSLRLFDSVEGSESSGERVCRELISHRVDPYKQTKKRNCQLVAVALDTDYIGSLMLVVDDSSGEENHILTVMSRENFLIDDDSNEDVMQVIDIRESVLNFLLSCEDVDHGLLQLHDYLANDGDLDNIDVIASQSLVECGFGRFMVEVAVAIPSIGNFDDHDSAGVLIFRKLFLFSTGVGAITWMSDSGPSSSLLRSLNEEITLVAYRREENYRAGYDIVSLSCVSPAIRSLSVDYGGSLQQSTSIEGTDLVRNEILSEQWSLRRSRKRPVVMLDYEVVVADNLVCEENGSKKSILTFYPMDNSMGRSALRRLDLEGNLEVCHLIALRETHVIAICRVFELTEDGDDVDQVAGHWFGPNNTSVVSSHAIVIDVTTRSEIYRTCFVDDLGQHLGEYSRGLTTIPGELPIQLAVRENTVAAGLGSKGVVMTGSDSRKSQLNTSIEREELTTPAKSSKKTKKKKQGKKSGKKDGFARGQKM